MARVKTSVPSHKRKKKIMKLAKGYRGSRSRSYRRANEQVLHSLAYAYRDRKNRKRDFRKWWIIRINAAVHPYGLNYSQFMGALRKAGIKIDRKQLAYLSVNQPDAFAEIVRLTQEVNQ